MLHGGKARRRLRTAAFITVVSVMFMGSLRAGRQQPRTVHIGEIRPVMSFSKVCVQGVAASVRSLNDGTRYCLLADETGSMPMFLNGASGSGNVTTGSRVAVTGHLGLAVGNRVCLRVPDAGHVDVLEDEEPVTVRGRVVEYRIPPPGSRAPCRLVLEHPAGRMELVHWFLPQLEIAAGDRVEARGTLGMYRGRMQLRIRDAGEIHPQPEG